MGKPTRFIADLLCRAVVAVGTVVGNHQEVAGIADGIGLTDSVQHLAESAGQVTKLQDAAREVYKTLKR
jgi:hypothetical protein